MATRAKVLTGLMERRALEAAFQELAETDSLDQLAERAQAIAGHGSAVLPVLVGLLDTADPQVRGGLGQVAIHLNREQIVPALRAVARARDRGDHARLTAMMILDRYLHEPVDESLMAGLQDPDEVAAQSLRELSHEMGRNPFVALEYLNQLGEQPAEVAGMVLDAIPGLGADPHLITLLRLFAQGPDLVLAQKAIEQIGRTRAPEASQALASLSQTLPPMLAGMADRGLRKLRLMGVPAPEPAPAAGLRALLSPIDGSGAQVVWFVAPATEGSEHPEHGTLLSVLCKDPEGIIASFGSTDVPVAELPPPLPPGGEYLIRQGEDGPAIRMLEVGADAGRVVVRDALHLLWQRGAAAPPEYRLLNPLIWNASPLADPPAASERTGTQTPEGAAALLDQVDFASWFWHAEPAYTEAEALGRRPSAAQHAAAVDRLIAAHFDAALTASYARRLAGMARWLDFAGQPETAVLAEAAASYMASLPPAKNPFCRRLVGIGLDVASANLRSGFDLRQQQNAP